MGKTYWVYILRCSGGRFYTGSTSDLEKWLSEHQNGLIKCYTRSRRPVKLVFSEYFKSAYDAVSAERQIKDWSRANKKALNKRDYELLVKLSKKSHPEPFGIAQDRLSRRAWVRQNK